ncbi:Uncharacterised protein [Vibrio cholerae]|nr:Uncharacterised protein [Vibrio cholerae]
MPSYSWPMSTPSSTPILSFRHQTSRIAQPSKVPTVITMIQRLQNVVIT